MKSFTLCFICFLITASLPAQDNRQDYIVSHKNDTTWGTLTEAFFGGFRFTTGDKKLKVKTAEYKLVCFTKDSLVFGAIDIDKDKLQWCDRLEYGKLTLYEFIEGDSYLKTKMEGREPLFNGSLKGERCFWYASKNGGRAWQVKSNNLYSSRKDNKATLARLMEDNQELVKEFNEAKNYSFNTVRELIRKYNQQAAAKKTALAAH